MPAQSGNCPIAILMAHSNIEVNITKATSSFFNTHCNCATTLSSPEILCTVIAITTTLSSPEILCTVIARANGIKFDFFLGQYKSSFSNTDT